MKKIMIVVLMLVAAQAYARSDWYNPSIGLSYDYMRLSTPGANASNSLLSNFSLQTVKADMVIPISKRIEWTISGGYVLGSLTSWMSTAYSFPTHSGPGYFPLANDGGTSSFTQKLNGVTFSTSIRWYIAN